MNSISNTVAIIYLIMLLAISATLIMSYYENNTYKRKLKRLKQKSKRKTTELLLLKAAIRADLFTESCDFTVEDGVLYARSIGDPLGEWDTVLTVDDLKPV